MPFHSRFSPDKGCSVYVWHIQESVEELEALLPQVDLPVSKSQQRRKERLAVRLLLQQAGITGLAYEESGKPYLVDGPYISISHSRDWVCVALHDSRPIGIDLECFSDRMLALSQRFMNAEELSSLPHDKTVMHLAWCAKEATYKIFGDSLVDFRASMTVLPFAFSAGEGEFILQLKTDGRRLIMKYMLNTDYALVYCIL